MACHFGHPFNVDVAATITLSVGSIYLVNSSAAPALLFFGVVAAAGISYASPAPASMLLIDSGLVAIAGIMGRFRKGLR